MTTSDDFHGRILADGPSPGTLSLVLSKLKEDGRLNLVIQECIKALKIYPEEIKLRRLLADTYFEAGLLSQAEEELETVTGQIETLATAFKLKAQLYERQNRLEESAEAIKIFLTHHPDDPEAIDLFYRLKPVEETHVIEPAIDEIPIQVEEAEQVTPMVSEESILPEIATPTLAEIYFDQGQVQEAINIYEKVVSQNSEDENSINRLKELKSIITENTKTYDKNLEDTKQRKERLISVLESWLVNIRQISKVQLAA